MKQLLGKSSLLIITLFLLYESLRGFQKIAWGSGNWWGEFSMKWAMAYVLYCAFCVFVILLLWAILFRSENFQPAFDKMVILRGYLGSVRWFLALLVLLFPAWFFQYTPWGIVFHDVYIRSMVWAITIIGLAFLVNRGNSLIAWSDVLLAALVTSAEYVIVDSIADVTSYPFSLGWSEGNRLWDYSIMFGRHLYNYPADGQIPVFLDKGRQFIGGIPFLIPGLTIGMERFWVGLTLILPYLLLGFATFRFSHKNWLLYLLTSLWVLIFLKQGPIHPPLVLCAVVVALAWRSPLWLALPLVAMTGYAAVTSRYTWLFAPGMWIGMLELAGAELRDGKLSLSAWVRAISLGLIGMAGGLFGPKVASLFAGNVASVPTTAVTVAAVSSDAASQPLLWYRLFPNATYGVGILVGLLITTLPLILVLFWLVRSRKWELNIWQILAIVSPLLAFLAVGLIVSTKIGGGGDLHNMDMFLIGLMFAAAIGWEKARKTWLSHIHPSPIWINVVLLLAFTLPGFQSLKDMYSRNYVDDSSWLVTLTDTPTEESLKESLNMMPSEDATTSSLDTIREEVASAQSKEGEILFMDQRQLLTFGFIRDVPLVSQYEKKVLMNEALNSNSSYFKTYYADLAAKRFSLIVSEPLHRPVKDSSFQFGEENNAWVKWVSIPTLCYYEPKVTLKEVGVQLLFPRADAGDCLSDIPVEARP